MVFVWKHVSPARIDAINGFFRTSGHFLGYGILALLFFRAIRRTVALKTKSPIVETTRERLFRWACEAVFCTAIVAAADEWHQSFLPSRTGAVHDVVLDTAGAIVLLMLVMIRYAIKPKTSEAN